MNNSIAFQGKAFRSWQGLSFLCCNWYTWFSFLAILLSFFYSNHKRHVSEYVKVHIFELRGMIWRYDWSSELCTQLSEAVVKLKLYTENKEWGPNQTWMFLGFNFTTALSCEHKCDDQSYLHYSPQFKYMNPTCILHLLRLYYELTKWPAPSWFDSSVGRAPVLQRALVRIPFRPDFSSDFNSTTA